MSEIIEQQPIFGPEGDTERKGSVECLGLTFASDEARRAYFTDKLREALAELEAKVGGVAFTTVAEVTALLGSLTHWPMADAARCEEMARRLEAAHRADRGKDLLRLWKDDIGFPHGNVEDILWLSDPPYYTACPNPFLPAIVEHWHTERAEMRARLGLPDDSPQDWHQPAGTEATRPTYRREPFAADVSEGKSDPIYNVHAYHTKVPHKAIMRYILHYTEPGDVVLDGFCGTGMAGVAAQLCGDRSTVISLGYRVGPDDRIYDSGRAFSRLGTRRTVLGDLSPAATFIAQNLNTPLSVSTFEREARRILREVEDECGWMYETWYPNCDDPGRVKARITSVVWSEVLRCPECGCEIIFLDEALDRGTGKVKDSFPCPKCSANVSKRSLDKCRVTIFDQALGRTIETLKRVPVLIECRVGRSRNTKDPDHIDASLLQRIDHLQLPSEVPTAEIPFMHMTHQRARLSAFGITHVHHFYFWRTAQVLGRLWSSVAAMTDTRLRAMLFFWLDSHLVNLSVQNRYRPEVSFPYNPLNGVYYVSSLISEADPFTAYSNKATRIVQALGTYRPSQDAALTTTANAATLNPPSGSIDYIFTDPPFGENIYYADLNYLVESWHKVVTNSGPEAIIDQAKRKGLRDYQQLMAESFRRCYRALKPGRWITVEFHNSHSAVWNTIQEALIEAGFVVADVRILDKRQASYRQVTAASAAQKDLVISAYKPSSGFVRRFLEQSGTAAGAWEFVRQHLLQVPVVVPKGGVLETVAERQPFLLFDRMVAFHVQRGVTVPLSAAEFYAGLRQRFVERDDMFFLPDQAVEYDRARTRASGVKQLVLSVTDENSTIQWLRQQLDTALGGRPQTYQQIQPQFLAHLHKDRHEKLPELSEILRQSFLQDEAARWYVPDPNSATDLEKRREEALLKEFEAYRGFKGRKLKEFRLEAVRAGFKRAWSQHDYQTILDVTEKIPEEVLHEDPKLLMWYDNAVTRSGREM